MREVLYVTGITVSLFFVSCLIACALPIPHPVYGCAYDNIGNPIQNVEIVLTNERTNAQLYVITNELGEYQQDAYNFVNNYKDDDSIYYYARYKGYKSYQTSIINVKKGGTKCDFGFPFSLGFVTSKGSYPSIAGTHKGTITPNVNITVSSLYTYPCAGTGGHAKYISLNGEEATWDGYNGEWSILTFDNSFVLEKNKTYEYEIRTGSYPQIIHKDRLEVPGGIITCSEFVDVNGKIYSNKILVMRLGEEI